MLAKKADEVPTGEGWLFEVKWDGVRCVATVKDGRVSMQSRSAKSEYMERWPGVAEALSKLPDCVLDGELVVFDDNGDSSFESIGGEGRQAYVVFDVLEYVNPIHGYQDVRDRTLEQRRGLLEWMGIEDGPIAISPAFTDGEELLAVAAGKKLEGIVAKRASSPYREGTRTDAWLKLKLRCSQEFVVIGWKPGQGEMAGAAGSLLLAVNDQGVLSYCGRVGAGPTYVEAKAFMDLAPIERAKLRLDLHNAPAPELRDVVWVKPELVVQVRFQRWTEDGRLWHPTIAGVRTDKQAGEVVREA
jgi:bifunctional non-homologous end joining protein LigD